MARLLFMTFSKSTSYPGAPFSRFLREVGLHHIQTKLTVLALMPCTNNPAGTGATSDSRLGDRSVLNPHNAISEIQHARIMSDDHDRAPALVRQFLHHLHHVASGVRVERSRRLIRQNDRGIASQRARDSHALLLAATQVGRKTLLLRAEPDLIEQFLRTLLRDRRGDTSSDQASAPRFRRRSSVGNKLNP